MQSEEEAVALANSTPFGLGSYVITNDSQQAERVADGIDASMVYVNIVGADSAELPVRRHRNVPASDASSAATARMNRRQELIRIGQPSRTAG